MPGQSDLDAHAVLACLGIGDADEAEPVTGGADTAIWRVVWRGEFYALRLFRPEQVTTCEREVATMQAAAAGGIPVPDVVRRGTWEGRSVLLLSWIGGQTLSAQLRAHPRWFWQSSRAFGQTQAAIHRLNAPAGMSATEWIEWVGDEPELKARLYDLPSRKTRLIHLDYHPLNVMVQGGQVSGVLDWANARAGDPRADFARTYTILRVEPYSPDDDSLWLALARRLLERFWRAGYVQAGGDLNDMALFYAWAGAAMIRDLTPRVRNPDHWVQDKHLDGVRAWRDRWKRRVGV
jgi:aminoglycoside phosphotransferase (APT) family kinase protein